MLKIVDVHGSATVNGEYVVLQNHGLTTLSLQGWIVATEAYASGMPFDATQDMYVFTDDVPIKPYARVVLFTGAGRDGWRPTNDGKPAYVAFWGQSRPVWSTAMRIVLLQPSCSRRIGVPAEAVPVAAV